MKARTAAIAESTKSVSKPPSLCSTIHTPSAGSIASNKEERWQTLGLARGIVILFVAHTWTEKDGEEVFRIISARKATPRERRFYEEGGQEE